MNLNDDYIEKGVAPFLIVCLLLFMYAIGVVEAIDEGYTLTEALVYPIVVVGIALGGLALFAAICFAVIYACGYLRVGLPDDIRGWLGRE